MMCPNQAADSHEIRPLTGVRGCAALMVVLQHYFPSWEVLFPSFHYGEKFAMHGHLGVDLFFILSGFILCLVYGAGRGRFGLHEFRHFLWFRIARVYPTHLATLGVLVALVVVADRVGIVITGNYPLADIPFQLTMTHAWPFWGGGGEWNYPSWSISAEWFAYLFMFPASWVLLRGSYSEVTWVLAACALTGIGFYLSRSPDMVATFSRCCQVSFEFLAGSFLCAAYREPGFITRGCHSYGTLLLLSLLLALCVLPFEVLWAEVIIVLILPFFLLSLTGESTLVGRLLSLPLMLWLGRISYAIYMSHAITQKLLKIILPAEAFRQAALPKRLLVLATTLAAVIGGAAALYYMVEEPWRKRLRRVAIHWQKARGEAKLTPSV